MLFSIIIPVYKVEEYIRECVDSVLKQNFSDYEILLIDDGSPDRCGEICDEYAGTNNRLLVFHKSNGGLSDARNYGMERASGEYIIFLDGDDWIEDGCLAQIATLVQEDKPDVIETTLIEDFHGKCEIKDSDFAEYLKLPFDRKRAIYWCCKKTSDTWPAQKKIYAKSFLKRSNIVFATGRLHEDLDWTSHVLYHASTFCGYPHPWYHHRMARKGSITNTIRSKNVIDVIEMADIHYSIFLQHEDEKHKMIFERIMTSVYSLLHYYISKCDTSDKEMLYTCMKKHRRIFDVAPEKKYALFSLVLRTFGEKCAMRLLSLI